MPKTLLMPNPQRVVDAMNERAAPGVRWALKGSPEDEEFRKHDEERREQDRIARADYASFIEQYRPDWDAAAVKAVREYLHWYDAGRWWGSLEVHDRGSMTTDSLVARARWLAACSTTQVAGTDRERAQWVMDRLHDDDAIKRFHRAEGYQRYSMRPFDLGWDGNWRELEQQYRDDLFGRRNS